jgi:hypothetical protein
MVVFNKENHTYLNPETNRFYRSVSKVLSLYKEPFNRDLMAERTAKKTGKTTQQVIEQWSNINKNACDKGHTVHDIIEQYIKTGKIIDSSMIFALENVFEVSDFQSVKSEQILFNDEYEIAGTSDIIADVDDKHFDVYDFKTNKNFLLHNKYGTYLKFPLNNLQQCHYNDYSIQLSLYAYLYSLQTKKKLRKICILYHDGKKFTSYPTPFLFWEITALINHYVKTHGQSATDQNQNVIAKLQ